MRRWISALAGLVVALASSEARAVRPFVTDDARVVGKGQMQLETWFRVEPKSFQHWAVGAVGPNDRMELSVGFVHGVGRDERDDQQYSIGGPLFQGKLLVFDPVKNSWPGVAVVIGGVVPAGRGSLEPEGWAGFAYLALTESLWKEDRILVHANVGFTGAALEGRGAAFTFGVGTEFRIYGVWHGIAELYSGDPYVGSVAGAVQAGFRFFFEDHLQLDMTAGTGVFGERKLPPFFGMGVRLVSHRLF